MELKDFVAAFAEQFEDTDPSEINAGTAYHDLDEWSSLVALGVIAMAKTEYGKTLTGKEINSCITVEQLFTLLNNKE